MILKETKENGSAIFNVLYKKLELEFELFTIEYICSELEKQKDCFESIHRIMIPERNMAKCFREIYMDGEKEKYHFFSYIKFFEYKGLKYGLVGGKTNYSRPDISFDYLGKKDNRISRTFLDNNHLRWSREVIIINHTPYLERHVDEKQTIFIECFLQRRFNLFNS